MCILLERLVEKMGRKERGEEGGRGGGGEVKRERERGMRDEG